MARSRDLRLIRLLDMWIILWKKKDHFLGWRVGGRGKRPQSLSDRSPRAPGGLGVPRATEGALRAARDGCAGLRERLRAEARLLCTLRDVLTMQGYGWSVALA